MDRLMSWMLAALLVVSAAGCSRRGEELVELPEPSQVLEMAEQSQEEPDGEKQSAPKEDPPEQGDPQALYQDILLTYGGEYAENGEGETVLRVNKGISLFYAGDWDSPADLDAGTLFSWYFTSIWHEGLEYEELAEKYRHPHGEDYGWFFPQEYYEPGVQEYFDVTVEQMRSDPLFYSEELEGYVMPGGAGIGETPDIVLEDVEQEGNRLTLHIRLAYEHAEQEKRALTVELKEDGGYRFQSYVSE